MARGLVPRRRTNTVAAPRVDIPLGQNANGVASADFDGNGTPDVASISWVASSVSPPPSSSAWETGLVRWCAPTSMQMATRILQVPTSWARA